MTVQKLEERPPLVRFDVLARNFRDAAGVSFTRDVEYIFVTTPGGKNTHVAVATEWIENKRQASLQDPPQFPPQWVDHIESKYQNWKRGIEIPEEGTPIRSWPVASPAEVKRCIAANVLTVEDLASLTEEGINTLGMGARALKQKAEKWLEEKNGTGRLAEENEALRKKSTEQDERINELERNLHALLSAQSAQNAETTGKRRGRQGRPPEPLDDGPVIR